MSEMLFTMSLTLFMLMDPLGNIPIYIAILHGIDEKKRLWIILREKIIALLIIILFAFLGDKFLKALQISHESIFLAGGIVLFIMSFKLTFPEKGSLLDALAVDGEPLIFPLAVPLVAGPSVLAAVMIYSHQLQYNGILYSAIGIAWVGSTIILMGSSFLQRWLGIRGIKALERLMGLILMLIAINMFLKGVVIFQQTPSPMVTGQISL